VIPAYTKYQNSAKLSLVKSSLNVISKSFKACRVISDLANCDEINEIGVEGQSGATLSDTQDTTAGTACFLVKVDGTTDFEGCYDNAGTQLLGAPADVPCNTVTESWVCPSSGTSVAYTTPTSRCTTYGCSNSTNPGTCNGGDPNKSVNCGGSVTSSLTNAQCTSGGLCAR